ncbi:MAG: GAF domain-containing protein [Chloroflexia bacterium]
MTTKSLRRMRHTPTGPLRKLGTRPLGETGLLRDQQSTEQLLAQLDKLLVETEVLATRFTATSDVAVAVNSSLHLDNILDVLVEKARPALGFDYCAVGMLQEGGQTYSLRSLAWPRNYVDSMGTQTFNAREGLPGSVLSSGRPLTVQNLSERPLKVRPARFTGMLHPGLEGRLAAAGLRSIMVLPLIASGHIIGCLSFAKSDPDYYSQDDLQIAYLFSMLLATALQNSRLFDAESRRSHQLQMLSEIGHIATSILDTATLLAKIPPLVQTYFGYDVVKIGLLDKEDIVYAAEAQYIAGSPHPPAVRLKNSNNGMPVGVVGLATYTGQMVLVPNVYEDERWSDIANSLAGPHIHSVLIIPMSARDRVLGVLHFESSKPDAFSSAAVSILQSLGNQLGVALDNAALYQKLNELFHGYIAPQVASTLLDDPLNAQLGGQKREVTVLFADIDGFTGLSEELPAEELLELLNQCLGVATEAILEYGGTIDKYMGDAVMALFNAPQDQPDHAWRAVQAAIMMQRKISELTASWEHKLIFSIGLHSGEAVVGNIGSDSLRNFTAIGDTVNLAKRIQEFAATGQVLITKDTYGLALVTAPEEVMSNASRLVVHLLGTATVKGRSKPAVIYDVDPYVEPEKMEVPARLPEPSQPVYSEPALPVVDPHKGKTHRLMDPHKGRTRSLAGLNPFRF